MQCVVGPFQWYTWLNLIKSFYINFKDSGWECGDLFVLWLSMASLICKFPCLLTFPPRDFELFSYFLVFPCSLHTGASFRFYLRSFWVCEPTVSESQNWTNGSWDRGVWETNPEVAIDLYVGRGGRYVRGLWIALCIRGQPQNTDQLMFLFSKLPSLW